MFEIPFLDKTLLEALGKELGNCDFSDPNQVDFLTAKGHRDVQAAPGNGKTTLLGAKLALLSRNWTRRDAGVCVISHTNAARTEVEDLIAKHPAAARLMAYPHFTGTVTAFINQYIALPYLRGLGWSIRQIDDDVFFAEAMRRSQTSRYYMLKAYAKNQAMAFETFVRNLDLHPDFAVDGDTLDSVEIVDRPKQPKATSDTGIQLRQLKASMIKSGLYRYADMTALGVRALKSTPGLPARLRARFPLVILDEAQDTHGAQLKLLQELFDHPDAAFQRLGDSNQTLYEDPAAVQTYWVPAANCVPLNESRRFGKDIAAFASRLTTRRAQVITGIGDLASTRLLILFNEETVANVLETFAAEATRHWGDGAGMRDLWAVASRHKPSKAAKGDWKPKSLTDYQPDYRGGDSGDRASVDTLCHRLQRAAAHHAAARPPIEVAHMLAMAISGVARAHQWRSPRNKLVTAQNLWPSLAMKDRALPRRVRILLHNHILVRGAPWASGTWQAFVDELLALFAIGDRSDEADAIAHYCRFVPQPHSDAAAPDRLAVRQASHGGVTVRLGSIHSVKGKSVDGILVLESEVFKGGKRCMDLEKLLPHAFGVRNETFADVALSAATNIFVGVTRPRELLGLAARGSVVSADVRAAAIAQGWKLVDLVAPPLP